MTGLRERIVEAAVVLTTDAGWAQVTMAKLADQVGVSRQTVYNEIGTKPALAEAMILAELDRFLQVVSAAFDRHPDDLVGAIRDASCAVLELAQDNRLLHAVVSATHGADTELLPLLTTHAESLLAAANLVVAERVAPYDVRWTPHTSRPPSTWWSGSCSATSCSRRRRPPRPPTTSPGSRRECSG